jgi:hypothetical protein
MLKLCTFAVCAAAALGGNTAIVTFDGAKSTTHEFVAVNDPVMGGQSSSTFKVERKLGVFDGTVRIVPSLGAAGFCNANTEGTQSFPDVRGSQGLGIRIMNSGNLTGIEATVTTKNSGTVFKHGDYSGAFEVPSDGNFHEIELKWDKFQCKWRGEPIKCPTITDQLDAVTELGLSFGQAPNVPGSFHVEIESIYAVGA